MDYNKEEYEKPWMEFVKVDTEQSILTLSEPGIDDKNPESEFD